MIRSEFCNSELTLNRIKIEGIFFRELVFRVSITEIYFPTSDLNMVDGIRAANGQSKNAAFRKYPM